MDRPFQNAPEMGKEFEKTNSPEVPDRPEIDAEHWEPLHEHDEEPEEHNYDPPRPVYDPNRLLAPTPFGNIDVDVQQELSPVEQQAVRAAQQQQRDINDEFSDLRSKDEIDRDQDDFDARMQDRFNHHREKDLDLDR